MNIDNEALDRLTYEEVDQFKEEAKQKDLNNLIKISTESLTNNRIIAEGDSWFDYKIGTDIIDWLRNKYGYSVDNDADAGDTLENMIYGASIDMDSNRLRPRFKKILKKIAKNKPKVFLFSGGGNDVAGNEFINYLNHIDTGLPPIKKKYADHMVNHIFKKCLTDMILAVKDASPETPIIMHGYGHTAPTGKGARLIFKFGGPWIEPSLIKKGIMDKQKQRDAVFFMIDIYNAMLKNLDDAHSNFHYIDLVKVIDPDKDWANELHLRNSKFRDVAEIIHNKIVELTSGLVRSE